MRFLIADDGAEAAPSATPADFDRLTRAEVDKWANVIRSGGIQMQ